MKNHHGKYLTIIAEKNDHSNNNNRDEMY